MSIIRLDGAGYSVDYKAKKISGIANAVRCVPSDMINSDKNNVTRACLEYIAPLIQGEREVVYENGMPVHFVIK